MISQQQDDASIDPSATTLTLVRATGKALVWDANGISNATLDAGAIAIPGGRTVSTLSGFLANNATFNVLDGFGGIPGADATGNTDATTAIQATIAAAALVAGTVVFPAGTYKISRQTGVLSGMSAGVLGASLQLASNVTIQMAPGASLVQSSANTDTFYGNTLTDVKLVNLSITGKGGSDQGNGAELFSITGLHIEGCQVKSIGESAGVGGGGFVITSCDQFHLVNNRGTDCGYAFINAFRSTNGVISGNRHKSTRGTASGPVTCVYVDASSGQSADITVSDNIAIANNYAFQVRGDCVRISLTGNKSRGELGVGITVQSVSTDVAKDVTVAGNTVDVATAGLGGINFDGAEDCTCDANSVEGPATVAGINVNLTGSNTPTRISVRGNTVRGVASNAFGILVSAGTHVLVSENQVNCPASGQRSISFTGGSKHTARGNRVVAASFHAIDNTTDDCVLDGNYVDGTTNTGDGVKSTGAGCQVTNNTIKGTIAGAKINVSGAGSIARNNLGYNPVGPSSPSVTASPMTYTNGFSPATLYVKGGTVSSITTGGVTLASATDKAIPLSPNQAVIITYSSAPTLAVDVQ
jgi:hypothetical protein